MVRFLFAAVAAVGLSACATPYHSYGLGGGYSDAKIDESHYRVGFAGNGYASQERVWNFWIYRCAELTLKNGYTYFSLSAPPVAKAPDPAPVPAKTKSPGGQTTAVTRSAVYRINEDSAEMIHMAHGGGGGSTVYVPGGTIRTWHTDAIVNMYPDPLPEESATVLRAQAVLDAIGPYVQSDGKTVPIDRAALMARASVVSSLGAAYQAFLNASAAERAAVVPGPPNNVAKLQAAQVILAFYPQTPTWTPTAPGTIYLNDASVTGTLPDAIVFVVGSLDLAVGSQKLYRFSRYIANCETNSAELLKDPAVAGATAGSNSPSVPGPLPTGLYRAPVDLSTTIPIACRYRGYSATAS